MSAIPYMPLYVADYLADAGHLSTLEHGAYLLLIMNYWQRGKALPADEVQLARIARLHLRDWRRVSPVLGCLFAVSASAWTHKRIELELAKVRAKSLKAREAGLTSAQRRFNGRSTDVQRTFNHTDTDTDKKSSVDKSTGAEAPQNVVPIDPLKALFDQGVGILTASGVGDKQARGLIGKWRRDYGDGKLVEALTDCKARSPTNALEWLVKALAARGVDDPYSIENTRPLL